MKIIFYVLTLGFIISGCNNVTLTNIFSQKPSLSKGLIAYYPFNGNTNDLSGNQNNGIAINNYTFINGVNDKAIYVVGQNRTFSTSGGYVIIPKIDTANLKDLSISLWVKEDTLYVPEAGEAYIIFGNNENMGWCGIVHFYGKIQFAVGAKPNQNIIEAVNPIAIDFDNSFIHKWVFYTLVYSDGYLTAYINSIPQAGIRQKLQISGNKAFIASHIWSGIYAGQSTRLSGAIDEVRIYNRALSDYEIHELYLEGESN